MKKRGAVLRTGTLVSCLRSHVTRLMDEKSPLLRPVSGFDEFHRAPASATVNILPETCTPPSGYPSFSIGFIRLPLLHAPAAPSRVRIILAPSRRTQRLRRPFKSTNDITHEAVFQSRLRSFTFVFRS